MSARLFWIHLVLEVPARTWDVSLAFWAAATSCQLLTLHGEHGQIVTLAPERGTSWLKLQRTERAEARVHLDLNTADGAAMGARSRGLGARGTSAEHEVEVMCSPGGLRFRHTSGEENQAPRMDRTGRDAVPDQICIDIPSSSWGRELAFWQALTGRELETGLWPEFAFLGDPDPGGPARILLQRLDDHEGTVRAHLDFAVGDRKRQADDHEPLGAIRIKDFERWTQMQAPSGHVYCLTDRDPSTGRVRAQRPDPVPVTRARTL